MLLNGILSRNDVSLMDHVAESMICHLQSNEWTGKVSFGNRSLHSTRGPGLNPYEEAMSCVARTLAPFDDDDEIPVYGFGDGALHFASPCIAVLRPTCLSSFPGGVYVGKGEYTVGRE
jgi:Copine